MFAYPVPGKDMLLQLCPPLLLDMQRAAFIVVFLSNNSTATDTVQAAAQQATRQCYSECDRMLRFDSIIDVFAEQPSSQEHLSER